MNVNSKIKAVVAKHRTSDEHQLYQDIQSVMAAPAGRRLFMAIVMQGGVYTRTERSDNLDYISGRRDAALDVMHAVNRCAAEQILIARRERQELISSRNSEIRNIMNKENNR